jgi:Permuted papain-like amidase enzyme, YaeF/YiiX, C92 family
MQFRFKFLVRAVHEVKKLATFALLGLGLLVSAQAQAQDVLPHTTVAALAAQLQVGDVVFIRVDAKPFREIAAATGSWTNHVGVVVDTSGPEPLVGESKLPFSKRTPLTAFVARSQAGRVAVTRLGQGLTPEQATQVVLAAQARDGVAYDTGFNLLSQGQFCSRYVREVMLQATGVALGEVETFAQLMARRPDANLAFWRLWFLGRIPLQRQTVTPASVLASPALRLLFDGTAVVPFAPLLR